MPRPILTTVGLLAIALGAVDRGRGAEADGKVLLKKLQDHLAKKEADRGRDRDMTALVGELADAKYAPAKAAVYETVFYWFGFDDTLTAHPRLFAVKERLEREATKRARDAAAGLKDVKARSLVFLTNRKELAADPKAVPKYTLLVHVETTSKFDGDGGDTRQREQIAARLRIPADRVGLSSLIGKGGRVVSNVDARLDTQPGHFLMWKVCEFLKHSHDANDDRFLRWAVENGHLERGLASELIPELFPPEKRPDPAARARDAERLAVKIFAHYGLPKLEAFTPGKPGSFEKLLASGALSKEDGARIALHRFEGFSVRKNPAYSRRYEFHLHYTVEGDRHLAGVSLDRHGKVVKGDAETDTSSDVAADVKIMWSVDDKGRSPQAALEASSRVFNTVKLEGMRREKVIGLVGDPSLRPKGVYNAPFWTARKDELVCRFDTGAYGWQFNLRFDDKGVCTKVTRKWIH